MDIQVENVPEDAPAPSVSAAARQDTLHLAIAERFNIQTPNQQEDRQLAEVWAYAQGLAKSDDISDIIWEVIHLESVLGSPRIGEDRLGRLYKYAKLRRQEAQIREELKNVTNSVNIYR